MGKRSQVLGMNTSRAVWFLAHGDPGDLFVLHNCDRGQDGCVALGHLYLGSQATNVSDTVRAGRQARGNMLPWARLTPDLVREIRARAAAGENRASIARDLGVHYVTVNDVFHRVTWKHVE